MAAKRYWRLFIIHTNASDFSGIGKIKMADEIGGPNLATDTTKAAASMFRPGCAPALAFNGTAPGSDNGWLFGDFGGFANFGYGQWISYDFGAGNEKSIVEITIGSCTGSVNRNPFSMRVQSSNDNVNWSDEWIITYSAWVDAAFAPPFTKPDPIPGAASAWAVYGLQASPPRTEPIFLAAEVAMREAEGSANLCAGGTAVAWRISGGTTPAMAFDGNPATYWYGVGSDSTLSGMYIGYHFPAPVTVGWIDLTTRNDATFYNQCNNQGEIWVSNDAINWLVKAPWAIDPFTFAAQTQGFEVTAGEGAIVDQLFIVGIDYEYTIPFHYVRFGVGPACMAISPMFIQ